MKTARKVLLLVLCAALLVSATVMGTLAYLTDTDEATNTFTVGNVAITLDETDVDGSKTNPTTEGRDRGNEYKLIPGSTYEKDPVVHIDEGSEDAWIFVKVENGIVDLEAEGEGTIAAQMAENGWELVTGETDVYAYERIVAAEESITVFETFTIAGDVDISKAPEETIKVTAYAIQAENFDNSDAAWAAYNS